MASIYNILAWGNGVLYNKYDIVKHGSYFYYSIQDNHSGKTPEIGSPYWSGVINIPIAGVPKTFVNFFWVPSYNPGINHSPKILSIKFGDGYEQRLADGINSDLLSLNLSFAGRSEKEAASILHFLVSRGGHQSFYHKVHAPYNIFKKFVCRSWNSSLVYDNNITISATFEEVAA